MEFGATVCLPRMPECAACARSENGAPLKERLRADRRDLGRTRKRSGARWKSAIQVHDATSIRSQCQLLKTVIHSEIRLVQRPRKTTLMPEMWELPQSFEPPQAVPSEPRGGRSVIPSLRPTTLFTCCGIFSDHRRGGNFVPLPEWQ